MNTISKSIQQKFLTNTDHTGRFIVQSTRTGKTYYVEPIGDPHSKCGSIDPATGDFVNKKGSGKYRGSVDEKDSLITESNGFKNIKMLEPGLSPLKYIEWLDDQTPSANKA